MPLYKIIKETNGLLTGIWQISETEETFRQILTPEDVSDACENYLSLKRRLERYAVRALLFSMTQKHLKLCYHKDKSPYIQSHEYNISISHTNGFAAIALHPCLKPGIDIERPSPRVLKIKEHVFNQREIQQMCSGSMVEQEIYSTIYWCAKETAFKIIGDNVYNYKQTLSIQPFIYKEKGKLLLKINQNNHISSLPVFYEVYPDFILTWSYVSQ